MSAIEKLLRASAFHHSHLCPRQVLGVRMGLAGAAVLGLEIPRSDKRLLVIVETDGCFVSGIEVATGTCVAHRTLRVEDFGKVAATFVDAENEQAVRLSPRPEVRKRALEYVSGETNHYYAQLQGYQVMPDDELFTAQPVILKTPVEAIISQAGLRETCEHCGEEIINGRQVVKPYGIFCRACAGESYYQHAPILLPVFASA